MAPWPRDGIARGPESELTLQFTCKSDKTRLLSSFWQSTIRAGRTAHEPQVAPIRV
jgi:hypothetical protein